MFQVVKRLPDPRDPRSVLPDPLPPHMKNLVPKNPRPRAAGWFLQSLAQQEASLAAEALDEQAKDDPDTVRGLML